MERVNDVGILRIDINTAVVAALGIRDPFVVSGHMAPRRAAIVGPIQSEITNEINALRIGAVGDRDGEAAGEPRQASAGTDDLAPRDPAVSGLVETRTRLRRVRGGWVAGTRWEVAEPRCGENDVRRVCRARERSDAGLFVDVQRLDPGRSAVGRAEHATRVALGLEEVPQRADQDEVWVARVNQDGRNLLCALEADVPPRASGIGGLVHPVSQPFEEGVQVSRADVNHTRVRRSDLHSAYRRYGFDRIENGVPRFAGARRLPHAAVRGAEVKHAGLSNHARYRRDPSCAERADVAPYQCGQETWIEGLRSERSSRERDGAEHQQGWCAHC